MIINKSDSSLRLQIKPIKAMRNMCGVYATAKYLKARQIPLELALILLYK